MTVQTPGGAASAFFNWTVIVLILLAAGAVVVVAGMIYGNRLARQRHRAQEAAEERAEEAGIAAPVAPSPAAVSASHPRPAEPDPVARAAGSGAEAAPAPKPAAAPPPVPAPVAPAAVEPAIAGALALTTIKGLGPRVAALLAERGITRVDQLAALGDAEAAALDAALGSFAGRMARDRWIEQARLLASGDRAAYEAAFGKLG